MNDPGSLQNLNDIVVPGPVAWWPLAPGWYLLLAVLQDRHLEGRVFDGPDLQVDQIIINSDG